MLKRSLYAILAAIFLTGCSQGEMSDEKPVLTVSILPQKYFAEQIAGDNFKVNVLVPSGSGPETYEPTPRQIRDAANSKAVFITGHLLFEQTMIKNLKSRDEAVLFVDTSEGVDLIADDIVDHGDHVHIHGVDPHIWVSLREAKTQVETIAETIISVDPENEEIYRKNLRNLISGIEDLDERLTEKFRSAPKSSFLIYHPALSYFARDYGLTQISIEYAGKSPTPAHMKKTIDLAREKGLRDVIIQKEFERSSAKTVASELGGDVIEIDPLAENWLENMAEIGKKILKALNR